jgi:3-phosphoshikimate 1-carboxyvinyltransferase
VLTIDLPISKSIANRLLLLQARYGDPLMEVSADMPDDVRLFHGALLRIANDKGETLTIDTGNCGTAMRFLTAFCATQAGRRFVLSGCERMCERPIGQLVDALRESGADIHYLRQEGFPPLEINGKHLSKRHITIDNPQSTQFVSALLLAGIPAEVSFDSPYIRLTRYCKDNYRTLCSMPVEADWSAAAFWYEWLALHGSQHSLFLKGLNAGSLQGDKKIAELYEQLGVYTLFRPDGVVITKSDRVVRSIKVDFSATPDLYPALVITCHRLGVSLQAEGTERLQWKESNRLEAMQSVTGGSDAAYNDHRIAMALLAADRMPDNTGCISKSYPQFVNQLSVLQGV